MSARMAAAAMTVVFGALAAFALTHWGQDRDVIDANPAVPPAAAMTPTAPRTITLIGRDNMTFSAGTITAAPGEEITVALRTESALAGALVHHNFVLLPPTVSPTAFVMLAAQSHAHGAHVPEGMATSVIAATPVANAGETVTTTFRVPAVPGQYVYLCSVPGHFGAGMTGVLDVR